jgi:hypothetical protein
VSHQCLAGLLFLYIDRYQFFRLTNRHSNTKVLYYFCIFVKKQLLKMNAPSYPRGRVLEDGGWRPAQTKSSRDTISISGWMWWHVPVIPTVQGNANRRIMVQACPWHKVRPFLKNNQHQKSWWSGSNIECQSNKHEDPSSTTILEKKKKKKKEKKFQF